MTTAITDATTRTLREARSDDLAAIERLLALAKLPTDGVTEIVHDHPDDFIVADDPRRAGELLAVAGLEVCETDALLRSVAVHPDAQGHGLGRELVCRLVSVAESRGLRALYLLTTTAEHYFPRFGFDRIARDAVPRAIADTLEFSSACPASAVAMARTLD